MLPLVFERCPWVLPSEGNILAHDYKFEQGGAKSPKKWFRVCDSYGVDIQPGQDDALILAVVVVIDQMTSDVA